MSCNMRIGHGYDVHAFCDENKPLLLGGIGIKYYKSLKAYSDGDVVLHALTDALLGAMSEKDIGYHFPDNHNDNKNRNSSEFLKFANNLLKIKNYKISNLDITIQAEEPKLIDYIDKIKNNIADILQLNSSMVSIKATTTEKLGFVGRKEGIAVDAVVLIYK